MLQGRFEPQQISAGAGTDVCRGGCNAARRVGECRQCWAGRGAPAEPPKLLQKASGLGQGGGLSKAEPCGRLLSLSPCRILAWRW